VLNWLRLLLGGESEPLQLGLRVPPTRGQPRTRPAPELLLQVQRQPTAPTVRISETPWSPQAAELYHTLIRARMKENSCGRCGQSLEAASIASVDDGATFDDLGLSDESAVLALAATEHVSVRCARCGFSGDIGTSLLRLPSPIGVERQAPWDPHAVDLYRSLVGARLREHGTRPVRPPNACGRDATSSSLANETEFSASRLGGAAAAEQWTPTSPRLLDCAREAGVLADAGT
jgi:hypothetical protein